MSDIVVPPLGESVVDARVARWLKAPGDRVTVGEPLVELETEKIDLEVSADEAGVLAVIERREGEDVKIGERLGVIEVSPSKASSMSSTASSAFRASDAPSAGGSGTTAAAARDGEPKASAVAEDTVQPSNEDTPRPPAQPARAASSQPRSKAAAPEPFRAASDADVEPRPVGRLSRATPTARRIAREHELPLAGVPGTGTAGRVTKADVRRALEPPQTVDAPAGPNQARQAPGASARPTRAEDVSVDSTRREERQRMSRRRATIARRLVEAQRTAAMLTTFNEIDMSAVQALRQRRKDAFKARHGVGLGIAAFFVRAAVAALKSEPRLNAEIQGDDIVLKHYYDIGVAVGAEGGLVVPVLRDADRLSFAQIELAIRDLAARAGDGTLTLDDLRGGTFTITNGGVFGSLMSTPILNPPQVGILGLHKIEDRPVAVDRQVVIRPMMYVALSYDHRLVDGREAVQFLVRVKDLVEDPGQLLLEL